MSDSADWKEYSQCIELLNNAAFSATSAYYDRFQYELLGAYIAGYDAIDVIFRPDTDAAGDGKWNATVEIRLAFIPVDDTGIRSYPDEYHLRSIDLSLLDDVDLDTFRNYWNDDTDEGIDE